MTPMSRRVGDTASVMRTNNGYSQEEVIIVRFWLLLTCAREMEQVMRV